MSVRIAGEAGRLIRWVGSAALPLEWQAHAPSRGSRPRRVHRRNGDRWSPFGRVKLCKELRQRLSIHQARKPRDTPMNIVAEPSASASMKGLFWISLGRNSYCTDAMSDHLGLSGRK